MRFALTCCSVISVRSTKNEKCLQCSRNCSAQGRVFMTHILHLQSKVYSSSRASLTRTATARPRGIENRAHALHTHLRRPRRRPCQFPTNGKVCVSSGRADRLDGQDAQVHPHNAPHGDCYFWLSTLLAVFFNAKPVAAMEKEVKRERESENGVLQ